MKIRTNYVSNSSSSSFCIMGVAMPVKEAFNTIRKALAIADDDIDAWDLMCTFAKEFDIGWAEGIAIYEDQIVFGWDATYMKDDETLKEFKDKIQCSLVRAGIDPEGMGWHTDGGWDG